MQNNFTPFIYPKGFGRYSSSAGPLNDLSNNKKKALVFFGSPHLNGHTATALNDLIIKLSNNYDFTIVNSYSENIQPCMDCGLCTTNDNCRFDDFNKIHQDLTDTELLIIATPIYNLSFPSPLKAIFDRMQRYFCARLKRNIRPTFNISKQAILLLTQGSNDPSGIDIINNQLKLIFSVIDTKLIAKVIWQNTDSNTTLNNINSQIEDAINKLT